MATTQGFDSGSYDYRQMYDIKDLRGNLPTPIIHQDTLLYALSSNPDIAEFFHIVNKTHLTGILNNRQGNFTIFVPLNGGIPNTFRNPDRYRCRQIVLQHMLEQPVPEKFIKGSQATLLNTRVPGSSILVENWYSDLPMINRYSKILASQRIGNGIIYFIDKMILPDQNPLSNIAI